VISEPSTPPAEPVGLPDPTQNHRPHWKAAVAVGLSLIFAGLGHLFLRQWLRGFAFLLPNYFLYTISGYWPNGVLINIVCFIVSAVDAYAIAKNGHGIF
jgi:hypothetical protein